MPAHVDDNTSMSSQLSSSSVTRTYRNTKPLPYRLRQNTNVYLEDKSFTDGFTFLTNVVAAGTSVENLQPAFTPSPSVLALCATLIVHPTLTTKAKSDEDVRASNEALRFLRSINELVGPIHTNLKKAFTFQRFAQKRRRTERASGSSTPITPDPGDRDIDDDDIDSPFAREKSVFHQVEDFWQVVGWAFNCSIAYRKRWDRWKLWLDVMLNVLAEDLEQHVMQRNPQDSLISQYLKGKENRTAWREIMAAILADGGLTNMNKFSEIWKNETKERKVKESEELSAAKEIDLDEGNFGDYDDAIDDDDEPMGEAEADEQVEDEIMVEHSEDLGGSESIALRQRFLRLLVWYVQALPGAFPGSENLLDIYTEFLRPLPVPIFAQFTSTSLLEPFEQCCLLTNMMFPFLSRVPGDLDVFRPTQGKLIQYFLPQTANSTRVSENLKMSLIIEALLMNMWTLEKLQPGKALSDAVHQGIEARTKKCRNNNKRKTDKDQQTQLNMSAERINLILDMLNSQEEIPNAPQGAFSLDGTDRTPLSTLDSEMVGLSENSGSELSQPDCDTLANMNGGTHANDRPVSSSGIDTPESNANLDKEDVELPDIRRTVLRDTGRATSKPGQRLKTKYSS